MTADPASKLRALHEAADRVSANLVALELDSSRELLAASTLTGESAARWATANQTLTELWRRHGLLEELLQRADRLRGSRHAAELRELLTGPSIELTSSEVPLARRSLLGGTESAERCSPDQLLADMSCRFDEVKVVIAAIGTAWETLIPRLDAARQVLHDSQRLAAELDEAGRRDLAAAEAELARLHAVVTDDPLRVDDHAVAAVTRSLEAIHQDLEQSAALRRGFDARLLAARELLEEIRDTTRQAGLAHDELLAKISVPSAAAPLDVPSGLDSELSEIAELAQRGVWRSTRQALEDWTTRSQDLLAAAQRALEANRAPLEARNQFRSLLEAYQVKAKRVGRLEDPELAAIFEQAHEALFTAPTDLALAAQLVRRYQQALSASGQEARS